MNPHLGIPDQTLLSAPPSPVCILFLLLWLHTTWWSWEFLEYNTMGRLTEKVISIYWLLGREYLSIVVALEHSCSCKQAFTQVPW